MGAVGARARLPLSQRGSRDHTHFTDAVSRLPRLAHSGLGRSAGPGAYTGPEPPQQQGPESQPPRPAGELPGSPTHVPAGRSSRPRLPSSGQATPPPARPPHSQPSATSTGAWGLVWRRGRAHVCVCGGGGGGAGPVCLCVRESPCVYVCVKARVLVRACVCVCICKSLHVSVWVRACVSVCVCACESLCV